MSQDSQEDMEEKYIEAIQEYYQLKKDYDKKLTSKKNKINKRDLSSQEKKIELKFKDVFKIDKKLILDLMWIHKI